MNSTCKNCGKTKEEARGSCPGRGYKAMHDFGASVSPTSIQSISTPTDAVEECVGEIMEQYDIDDGDDAAFGKKWLTNKLTSLAVQEYTRGRKAMYAELMTILLGATDSEKQKKIIRDCIALTQEK